MVKHSISTKAVVGLGLALTAAPVSARAADAYMPIVVPVTGFMSVAGGSQRNGAVMAAQNAPSGLKVDAPVFDTGTSASGAATALDKALSDKPALAASASVFGTETVAMVPVSADYKVPLLTISGLSKLTESGNKYVFRFLPNDREIKVAHARYVVDTLKAKKIALIGDTTAYGQGGYNLLKEIFEKLGDKPVLAESVEPDAKDMSSVIAKIKDAGADALVIHGVDQPMALLMKQSRAAGLDIPIVDSSSIVEATQQTSTPRTNEATT
jgi:branched-chain amino acid transport system substrate-binding protein